MTKIALYTCGHHIPFKDVWPQVDEHVICRRCRNDVRVVSILPEYRSRCETCRWSVGFGADYSSALDAASAHSAKHGHTVKIWEGNDLTETVNPLSDDLNQTVIDAYL